MVNNAKNVRNCPRNLMEFPIFGHLERLSENMGKPRKNRQKWPKWGGQSGVPDFNGNFGIFIFEIERWSEKVKCRKLSKEFDGIKIFLNFCAHF